MHGVQELLVLGRPLLGTEVKVQGYITWVYNCARETRLPQKKIDDDPTVCERPKFYLGAEKTTPPERALWIVDVPRAPNKLERERLPKADLAKWPVVPRLAVGDFVAVTGTFSLSSPHAERNSSGLLVFKSIAALDPATLGTPPMIAAPEPPAVTLPALVKAKPSGVTPSARSESIVHANAGTRAYAARQYDQALTEYQAAVNAWPDNHTAWYGLAGVRIGNGDFAGAREAIGHAATLLPDEAMYWMIDGYTRYEEAHAARPVGDLSAARQSLEYAVKLNPKLWRAHYYLGRIHRDRGFAKVAAEQLSLAIESGTWNPNPYVALVELYRQWQYTERALAVAMLGTTYVRGPESSDVWFELGMAYEDTRDHDKAIEAFTKALDAKPGNVKARFQRGQAYFYKKDWAHARPDLEAFMKASGADVEFAKQQASKMLLDLAAKK